ncbi:dienelactone hydrolase family protein [Actinoplanes sp. NPDC051411]|uniref:dienelactone hydrolase family protein n=1 Tax=Actinoplanes sp. NPDC051411 TaxID=3155522 RepID=UPI0034199E39
MSGRFRDRGRWVATCHNQAMAKIVLFHSMLGLRSVELRAADRLRAAGHEVITPDLYARQTASTLDEGFQLKDHRIGWATIEQRADQAVQNLPADTVLAGISMGAGVVSTLLPQRPDTAGVLLLHGLAPIPTTARDGLPVQLHVADADEFAPPVEVAAWLEAATRTGVDAQVFTYQQAGHFFTDPSLPDHNAQATTLTWQRVLDFLRTVSG